MIRFTPSGRLPFAAAIILSALSLPALAQGTEEQREACAPDAVRLCQDTIPDIPKTTACMEAHKAELTPQCRAVFSAATEALPETDGAAPQPRPRKSRVAHEAPFPDEEIAPAERHYRYRSPETDAEVDVGDDDVQRARAVIARLCADEMIDPRTCGITERALNEVR